MTLQETNWEEKLRPEEIIEVLEDGRKRKMVLLRGLQRLAREAGLYYSDCILSHVPGKSAGVFQCIYTTEFNDHSRWVGTADVNVMNTNEKFMAYPTAVAESRAEARCLRKALGIYSMLAAEEIDMSPSFKTVSPQDQISDNVQKAIEHLCESRNVQLLDVINNVIDDKNRANTICDLSQLTAEEGQKALAWLNEQPVVEILKKGKKK